MLNFKSFGLPQVLVQTLEHLNITSPTPVQEKAIPAALAGSDVLATAQTGTGKTMAYLLPVITKMQDNAHEQALILAPTRELAEQIKNALVSLLGRKGQYDVALLIGGASIYKQFMALKRRPRFIIGTPGRIIDHLERGKLTLHEVRFLVLDEVDRMLDMGFSEALETILQDVPSTRQTLMFSATLPPNIAKLSKKYLQKPQHITIGSTTKAAIQVTQQMIKTTAGERFTHLLKELDEREGSVIIFVKTKVSADVLAEKLQKREHTAEAIHGDLRQRQREAVIRSFRKGVNRIMVATDIAARGLDIPHIKHVINYDLPQCAEDYIHRIGRTGRAGMEGFALSFVLPSEGGKWKAIHRLLNSDPSTAYVGDNQGGADFERRGNRGRSSSRRGGKSRLDGAKSFGGGERGKFARRPKKRDEGSSEGFAEKRRKPRGERDGEAREWTKKKAYGERKVEGERREGERKVWAKPRGERKVDAERREGEDRVWAKKPRGERKVDGERREGEGRVWAKKKPQRERTTHSGEKRASKPGAAGFGRRSDKPKSAGASKRKAKSERY